MLAIAVVLFVGAMGIIAVAIWIYRRASDEKEANGAAISAEAQQVHTALADNAQELVRQIAEHEEVQSAVRIWQSRQLKLPVPHRKGSEAWYKTVDEVARFEESEKKKRDGQVNRRALIQIAGVMVACTLACGLLSSAIYSYWSAPPATLPTSGNPVDPLGDPAAVSPAGAAGQPMPLLDDPAGAAPATPSSTGTTTST